MGTAVTVMVSPTALKTSMEYPSVLSRATWWSSSLTMSPRHSRYSGKSTVRAASVYSSKLHHVFPLSGISVTNFVMPDKCSVIQIVRTAQGLPVWPSECTAYLIVLAKLVGFQQLCIQRKNLQA